MINLFAILKSVRERKKYSNSHVAKAGFTLVELALVLVIIGLVVGGVLVGQDLIFAAKVRAQTSQIQEIETGMNTFRTKYNCTAGDCPNATDFFGTTDPQGNTVNNGNGDGIIKSIYSGGGVAYGAGDCMSPDATGEVSAVFQQMYLAGIGKDYTTGKLNGYAHVGTEYPYAKYGNGTGIIISCLT
jgi:prepilin-type N-terminal cleavage/methylation domain-containing protein